MIWRGEDGVRQEVYCDLGPYAGKYRMTGYLYGTHEEIVALMSSRNNEVAVAQPDGEQPPPAWWPYAAEFPDWHVWLGVSGLLYARRPKSSPPKVVSAKTHSELREQIIAAEQPKPFGVPDPDCTRAGCPDCPGD